MPNRERKGKLAEQVVKRTTSDMGQAHSVCHLTLAPQDRCLLMDETCMLDARAEVHEQSAEGEQTHLIGAQQPISGEDLWRFHKCLSIVPAHVQ